jgi:uncharacterized protein with gpF-like domain
MSNEAQIDLVKKIRLESRFRREVNRFFNKVLSYFSESVLSNVPFSIPERFDDELKELLLSQYNRVESDFGNEVRKTLPNEIQSTNEENEIINESFASFNFNRSTNIANEINQTTQDQAQEALLIAKTFDTEVQEEVDGQIFNKKNLLVGFELALVAKNILQRKILDRIPTIVTTETEISAETAKLTEIEVLTTQTSSILAGTPIKSQVNKTWVSQGDSRVRETHLEADGQTVPSNEPFIVGDSRLMVPGDTSLGASLDEIINCRCAAQYDDDKIVAIRFEKLNDQNEQVIRAALL